MNPTAKVSEEVNKKSPARNMTVIQLYNNNNNKPVGDWFAR